MKEFLVMQSSVGRWSIAAAVLAVALVAGSDRGLAQTPPAASPKVGDPAKDFSLRALDGSTVQLSREVAKGRPIVLVVLRGWPGYQCPFCTRQFGEYLTDAPRFEA